METYRLSSKLIFIGGMAEAKSKGRGEECISQNLRILRGHNGQFTRAVSNVTVTEVDAGETHGVWKRIV
jgi:hypothetical protein